MKDRDLGELEAARNLRNRLAHADEDLAEGGSWRDGATWVETLVNRSDELIEQEAAGLSVHMMLTPARIHRIEQFGANIREIARELAVYRRELIDGGVPARGSAP